MEKSGDDCYFYYYSTCNKGDECPYRHSESALGSEIVCSHWREGNCLRPNVCKYRHMESRINRSSIQCWFETQPMGCRKPHCVFLHKKPKNEISDEDQKSSDGIGIILPVVTNANNSDINCDNNTNNTNTNGNNNCVNNNVKPREECSKMKLFDDSDYMNQSLSAFNETTTHNINIEPISISINDCDEESDNDNEMSINSNSNDIKSKCETENNYNNYENRKNSKNYGIKTLEQIRMEKVFNQENDECLNDNNSFDDNFCRTDSMNKSTKMTNNKDLRVKIRRRPTNDDQKASNTNFNNTDSISNSQPMDSVIDFGVKTLDQIRREREEALNKKLDKSSESDCQQNLVKENQELRGEKRVSTDPLSGVVKIRRTGPIITNSPKDQQILSEREKSCEKTNSSSEGVGNEESVTSTKFEVKFESSDGSSSDSSSKQRIKSVDTDLDEFDFLDGDSSHNIDTNAMTHIDDDDEDDELMREINQVINS